LIGYAFAMRIGHGEWESCGREGGGRQVVLLCGTVSFYIQVDFERMSEGGGGSPSRCLAGRRYFFQRKAMLTMIMTTLQTMVAMTGGVQIDCWSPWDDMVKLRWGNRRYRCRVALRCRNCVKVLQILGTVKDWIEVMSMRSNWKTPTAGKSSLHIASPSRHAWRRPALFKSVASP
jgi:hypothetical protein